MPSDRNARSAFARVFRRRVKMAFVSASKISGCRGAGLGGWNLSRTTAEVTFGGGRKAPAGSASTRSTSARCRISALRTP